MRKVHVTYTGAQDDHIDAEVKVSADGPGIAFVGASYDPASRRRNLQFSSKTALGAYEASRRLSKLSFVLDVFVL